MQNKNQIVKEINALLDEAICTDDPARALGKVEMSKRLLQDLYYQLWMVYHRLGTHRE